MKVEPAFIVEYLLQRQPLSIRIRLERDPSFGAQFAISSHAVIDIGGKALVPCKALFKAARRGLVRNRVARIGRGVALTKNENGSVFVRIGKSRRKYLYVPCDEMKLLSADQEERTQELRRILRDIGPTAQRFYEPLKISLEREPSDEEVYELLKELWTGVARRQMLIGEKIARNEATLDDLVPESLQYFDRFCGPDPGNTTPEVYISSILNRYRQELLRRDLQQGLKICLIGSLRYDLCPGAWLADIHDDDLWWALEACQPKLDPFSLVAALDLALYRQHDDRFGSFAESAVAVLAEERFLRPDGIDVYELLPLFADFVLNRVHLLENGALRPPFWKRMCAWMQAAVAVRAMQIASLDLNSMRDMIHRGISRSGRFADFVDIRSEPMFRAAEMSASKVRSEVVGRLVELSLLHQKAGRSVPGDDAIAEARRRLDSSGPPFVWALPGPLEGHRRPSSLGRSLPDTLKREALELSNEQLSRYLAYICQHFHVGEEVRAYLREVVSKPPLEHENSGQQGKLAGLLESGIVAAAERDQKLAHAIAAAVHLLAPQMRSSEVDSGLFVLLMAGAAFKKEGEWAFWLEEQLFEFAGRLSAGEPSATLWHELRELRKVTKLELGLCSRAEALASCAAS